MKLFPKIKVVLVIVMLLLLSCERYIERMRANDPCWQAIDEREKLKYANDDFEKQMIKQRIEVYDNLCNDQRKKAFMPMAREVR